MSMLALQLVGWQADPEFRRVPIPAPGPGQVLLKMVGAGLCHSDLHLMDWPAGALPYALPFTLGHENAGVVHALGAGVAGLDLGEVVLVYGPWGCGRCTPCRRGEENICAKGGRGFVGGLGVDGGLAEYMLVPAARHLVPLGDLDPVRSAPLGDAALTPYHVVSRALPSLRPGTTAVVIGVGGLGHVAVQLLRVLTDARVVAVDRKAAAAAGARSAGAHAAFGGDDAADFSLRKSGRVRRSSSSTALAATRRWRRGPSSSRAGGAWRSWARAGAP